MSLFKLHVCRLRLCTQVPFKFDDMCSFSCAQTYLACYSKLDIKWILDQQKIELMNYRVVIVDKENKLLN